MAVVDQRAASLDLPLNVADDWSLSVSVTENGATWSSTGATVATTITDINGTAQATNFTAAVSDGSLTLSLTDTQTTTLGVGTYRYAVEVTKSSLTRTWIAGKLIVSAGTTPGRTSSSATLSITNGTVTLGITSLVPPAAANITVADTANYYAGTTVETVLAEIPTREQTLWPWNGYDVLPRELATGTAVVTVLKDKFVFRTFIPPQDMIATGVQMASTATVSAGLTLCRFGLAHIGSVPTDATSSESRFTMLARTDSDTTTFNSANTLYTRSFSATGGWPTTVRLVKGERYAVGYWISGTTAPSLVSAPALARAQVVSSSTSPWFGGNATGIETSTDIPPFWGGSNFGYDGSALAWFNLVTTPKGTMTRPYSTAVFGDSYCTSYGGWAGEGNTRAGSRLLLSMWAGVGGDTTTQVLARIATVTAARPKVVIVSCGINDIANGTAATVAQANLTTIYQTLVAAGAKVIICTGPPTTSMDAGELVQLTALNTWIKALTATGVYPSDTGNALTTGDGVTQNAGLFTDGVHPNFAGCAAMGAVLAVTIGTVVAALGG